MRKTTLDLQLDDAAEILEAHDILLFVLKPWDSVQHMWDRLEAAHGEMIAVAKPVDGELVVSFHYNHKPVAHWIQDAFRKVGMRATWSGKQWDAVHVDLTPRQ